MASSTDFSTLSAEVLKHLGGEENVTSVSHCATRLRFNIKDDSKVHTKALENTTGVIALIKAGGQHQVVIGNEVPNVYAALVALPGMAAKDVKNSSSGKHDTHSDPREKKNILDAFVDMISSIFTPILWPLAGIALVKAALSMGVTLGWFGTESTNYVVFNAMADGLFYFLPLFLAVTAARKFKVNEFIAMATVAPLVYPSIVALTGVTEPLHLLGIPLTPMNYTSSVIPAIVTIWLAGYVQRFCERMLPAAIRNFMTPVIVLLVMVPLVLLTIGPATMYLAQGISAAVSWIFAIAPWLAGGLLGAFWQVLVIFGLHWGFVPIFLNDIANAGESPMMAPLQAAVLAQAAAVLAVAIRSKVEKRKKLAGPAAVSGLVAGVTEPAIYGVNLPLKVPFYAGVAGGAIGGIIIGLAGSTFNAFVFPSLLAFPAALSTGNFVLFVIGTIIAMAIGFMGTWIMLPKIEREEAAAEDASEEAATIKTAVSTVQSAATHTVFAPVSGSLVDTADIADKVFASGAMGETIAIEPADGAIRSPIAGTVIAAPQSGYAFGIKGDNGLEVLVHVGIDTVQLAGTGFQPQVSVGDRVDVGQLLVDVSLPTIVEAGLQATTIVIVTNSTKVGEFERLVSAGDIVAGEPTLSLNIPAAA
jgi:hypothetical protein